jgi:hypothetical protein
MDTKILANNQSVAYGLTNGKAAGQRNTQIIERGETITSGKSAVQREAFYNAYVKQFIHNTVPPVSPVQ